MKTKIKIHFIFIILLFILIGKLQSQYPDFPNNPGCGTNNNQQSASIPSNGTIKALVVFFKFKGDNFDLPPYTDDWPSSLGTNLPG